MRLPPLTLELFGPLSASSLYLSPPILQREVTKESALTLYLNSLVKMVIIFLFQLFLLKENSPLDVLSQLPPSLSTLSPPTLEKEVIQSVPLSSFCAPIMKINFAF